MNPARSRTPGQPAGEQLATEDLVTVAQGLEALIYADPAAARRQAARVVDEARRRRVPEALVPYLKQDRIG